MEDVLRCDFEQVWAKAGKRRVALAQGTDRTDNGSLASVGYLLQGVKDHDTSTALHRRVAKPAIIILPRHKR